MQRDSIGNVFRIAILLCLICSVAVSALAVGLREKQKEQKELFRQQNILTAAGLWEEGTERSQAKSLFDRHIQSEVVDLEISRPSVLEIKDNDPRLDPEAAKRIEGGSTRIDGSEKTGPDIASIVSRETFSRVYLVKDENGKVSTLILPIRGYGLWSTLWGFVALDFTNATSDPQSLTVKGLTYYKHGETPGLGGEVDNPNWKAKWPGRKVFDEQWNVMLEVSKSAASDYQVDAISGATLTSNGVSNMLQYWLGPHGYGKYIQYVLRQQTGATAGDSVADVPR
ncbi:MAG: Na(+)-translocating NADH-quinone reductase subunit C [Planctomycetaceae bacterium]|nr:Na(+)-translocating NADH-quinone reductase subunit C [Planctomycetaceae bacterium]